MRTLALPFLATSALLLSASAGYGQMRLVTQHAGAVPPAVPAPPVDSAAGSPAPAPAPAATVYQPTQWNQCSTCNTCQTSCPQCCQDPCSHCPMGACVSDDSCLTNCCLNDTCLGRFCATKAYPDSGWAPPVRLPVNRDLAWYNNYLPQAFYGNPGGGFVANYPQVYQPTDTTQLGYYYHIVPTWQSRPGMIPPVPNPADYHARMCLGGQGCHSCMHGTGPVQNNYCQSCEYGQQHMAAMHPHAMPMHHGQMVQQAQMVQHAQVTPQPMPTPLFNNVRNASFSRPASRNWFRMGSLSDLID